MLSQAQLAGASSYALGHPPAEAQTSPSELLVDSYLLTADRCLRLPFRHPQHAQDRQQEEGRGHDEDHIVVTAEPLDEAAFEKAKQTYYEIMGWERETGVPERKTLEELDIAWAAEHLPDS